LAPYYDIELLAETALEVLDDPAEYRRTLGADAQSLIHEQYSLDKVLPRMIRLYERGAATSRGGHRGHSIFAEATPEY